MPRQGRHGDLHALSRSPLPANHHQHPGVPTTSSGCLLGAVHGITRPGHRRHSPACSCPHAAACRQASNSSCPEKKQLQAEEGKGEIRKPVGLPAAPRGHRYPLLSITGATNPSPVPRVPHPLLASPASQRGGRAPAPLHKGAGPEQWSRPALPRHAATPRRHTGLCLRRHGERAPGARPGRGGMGHGTGDPCAGTGSLQGTQDTHNPPSPSCYPSPKPFSPSILAAPRPASPPLPAPAHSSLPFGERTAMIYSVNFPADEAGAGVTFPALPPGWQPPLPAAGGREPGAGQAGVLAGRGCVRTRRCSLPPAHSPFFLKKARSEERFLPMKTTMVAGERVWSPRGLHRSPQGLRHPPRRLCLLCRSGSHPAVRRQGGCRRPPAPSLRPHPHGGRMLGWAKRLRRSCLTLGTAARWQEGTAPAAPTTLLGHGRRRVGGPLLCPPRLPTALPPPPTHSMAGRDPSCRAQGRDFPNPPILHPWDPPRTLLFAPHWAQHPCKPVARFHNSASNWEELGGFSSGKYRPLGCSGIPPPCLSPVPPRTRPPPWSPQPCQGEPCSRHGSARSGRTQAITGQRVFVLRDRASSTATSRSRELAALGENEVLDQSNQ